MTQESEKNTRLCPVCETEVSEETQLCPECGWKIDTLEDELIIGDTKELEQEAFLKWQQLLHYRKMYEQAQQVKILQQRISRKIHYLWLLNSLLVGIVLALSIGMLFQQNEMATFTSQFQKIQGELSELSTKLDEIAIDESTSFSKDFFQTPTLSWEYVINNLSPNEESSDVLLGEDFWQDHDLPYATVPEY